MRDKIRSQSSTAIRQAISLSYVLIQHRSAVQKTWVATLLTSLGLASSLWFAQTAHIPQIAQAQTVNNITIERQPNETYESLVKRAEAAARAAVTNNLAPSRGATDDVSITVVAHDRGAIAPVLNLKVSRSDQFSPNAGGEITYFQQARSLLRLEEDLATTTSPATPRVRSRNTNRPSGVQTGNNSSTPSSSPQNLNPGNVKRGFGSNSGNFSQPGRVVTPSSGQPTSNFPSGQTGTTNVPTGQTSPMGTGLTPQSPSSTPLNTPSQLPNSTQPTGTGLTPQPPITPPVAPQSQPLSPSTPNSSNSNNSTNSTSGTTPSSSSSTTTTPGIIPSSR